jgi:menaquinone-dependent protoporphyrinogen oxidase
MRLAEMLRTRGIDSRAIDISSPVAECLDWSSVRASIVGASLHVGRHQPAAAAFVRTHASALNARPSVFLSVSLSAASKQDREVQTAKHLAEAFPAALGWHPERVACLAGRLAYTKYGPITRVVMQLISWREGGPTDTSRDYELTDWGEVDRLADEVTRMAAAPAPGVSAA